MMVLFLKTGNLDKAKNIAEEFDPDYIFIAKSNFSKDHKLLRSHQGILNTQQELQGLIQDSEVDIVISAISGTSYGCSFFISFFRDT